MNPNDASSRPASCSRAEAVLRFGATSILIHIVLFLLLGLILRRCEESESLQGSGVEFHEIGLLTVGNELQDHTKVSSITPAEAEADHPVEFEVENLVKIRVPPIEVPIPDQTPNTKVDTPDSTKKSEETLGIASISDGGKPFSAPARSPFEEFVQARASTSQRASAGMSKLGPRETAFMTVVGAGDSFVYVIDVSSSMRARNSKALRLAKSQLKKSLRLLENSQKFQVLFYRRDVEVLHLRSREPQPMYRATRLNIHLAESAIDGVGCGGGTDHVYALERGLKLKPDVVYFLTDGDDSQFSTAVLHRLYSLNQIGTQVHVIEFASGPIESRRRSKLQEFALHSGGKYVRYRVD